MRRCLLVRPGANALSKKWPVDETTFFFISDEDFAPELFTVWSAGVIVVQRTEYKLKLIKHKMTQPLPPPLRNEDRHA